jgi:flagellin
MSQLLNQKERVKMLNSVNTNNGAITALQSLNRTNSELSVVQKRISTGYKVADGYDDGASFSVAQSLRADVKAYEAVGSQLSKAVGTLTVAADAASAISGKMADIKGVLVKLANEAVTGDERTQYQTQYDALRGDIKRFIDNAELNGTNLLNAGTDVNVISTADGTGSISLTATDLTTDVYTALGAAPTTAAAAKALLASGAAFEDAQTAVNGAVNNLGNDLRSINNQNDFIKSLSDGTEISIGAIVDADLAKESARLQSLQIKQQLGSQALGIANQAPSILLSLFR